MASPFYPAARRREDTAPPSLGYVYPKDEPQPTLAELWPKDTPVLGYAVNPPSFVLGKLTDHKGMTQVGNAPVDWQTPRDTTYVMKEGGDYVVTSSSMTDTKNPSEQEVFDQYKATQQHFGKFNNLEEAQAYGKRLESYASAGIEKPYAKREAEKMPAPSPLPLGMTERGNIDLDKAQASAPVMAVYRDPKEPRFGQAVVFPGSIHGTQMSPEEATKRYKATGEHLGIFKDVVSATGWMDKIVQRPGMVEPPSLEGTLQRREFSPTLSSQEASAKAGRPIKSGTVLTDKNGNRIVVN